MGSQKTSPEDAKIILIPVIVIILLFLTLSVVKASNSYLKVDKPLIKDETIRKDEEFYVYQNIYAENTLENLKSVLHIKDYNIEKTIDNLVKGENIVVKWRVSELKQNFTYEFYVTWEYWINGNYHTFNSSFNELTVTPYPERSLYDKIALKIYETRVLIDEFFSFPLGKIVYVFLVSIMALLVVVKLTS